MSSFEDVKGNKWSISLNIGHFLDIKTQLKLDLLDDVAIPGELSTWVAILHIVLEDQIQSLGLKPRDFAKLMDGDSLQKAIDAFMESYAFFFRQTAPARSELVLGMWQKIKAVEEAKGQLAQDVLGRISLDLAGL